MKSLFLKMMVTSIQCWSRESKISRSLFCTKFSQMLNKKSLIMNIDDSLISRSTKIDYAWSKKGDAKVYKNSPFIRSASLIFVILSNRVWIAITVNSSINSELLWEIIKIAENWILKHKNFGFDNIIITLNNWPWHKATKQEKCWEI